MMSFGCINQLDAFDFSEASLGIAREKAAAKNLNIDFYFDDINSFEVPADRRDAANLSRALYPFDHDRSGTGADDKRNRLFLLRDDSFHHGQRDCADVHLIFERAGDAQQFQP